MTIDRQGIAWKKSLKVGQAELSMDRVMMSDEILAAARSSFRTYGLVMNPEADGVGGEEWKVEEIGGPVLAFRTTEPLFAITPNGVVTVEIDQRTMPTVVDDATWRTLTVRFEQTTYMRGSLVLTSGSTTITGTNTRFTMLTPKNPAGNTLPSKIRLVTGEVNAANVGEYEVVTVVSDTELTVASAPSFSETTTKWRLGGYFNTTPPAAPDAIQRWRPVFELVSRTRTPAAGSYVLADVMLDTGASANIQIIDRRAQSWARPRLPFTYTFQPMIDVLTPPDGTGPVGGVEGRYARVRTDAGGDLLNPWPVMFRYTDTATSPTMGVLLKLTGGGIRFRYRDLSFNAMAPEYLDFDGTTFTDVQVTSNTAATEPVGLQPGHSDGRIMAFYIGSNNSVLAARSLDGGASWAVLGTIWNPALVDAADTIAHLAVEQAPDGRVYISATYTDNSASTARTRVIYSDDYCDSWSTNSNNGYNVLTTGEDNQCRWTFDPLDGLPVFSLYSVTDTEWRIYKYASGNPSAWSSPTQLQAIPYNSGTPTRIVEPHFFGDQLVVTCAHESRASVSPAEFVLLAITYTFERLRNRLRKVGVFGCGYTTNCETGKAMITHEGALVFAYDQNLNTTNNRHINVHYAQATPVPLGLVSSFAFKP